MLRHVWLFVIPWTVACQAPLSMEFSKQEYWSHFLLQEIFPTKDWTQVSVLQADSLPSEPPGCPIMWPRPIKLPSTSSLVLYWNDIFVISAENKAILSTVAMKNCSFPIRFIKPAVSPNMSLSVSGLRIPERNLPCMKYPLVHYKLYLLFKLAKFYWVDQKIHSDFSRRCYGKNPNELFGQPNTCVFSNFNKIIPHVIEITLFPVIFICLCIFSF